MQIISSGISGANAAAYINSNFKNAKCSAGINWASGDQTANIQAAIDYVNALSGGGSISFEEGVYSVTSLTMKSNVRLIGNGNVVFRNTNTGASTYIFELNNVTNVALQGISAEGRKTFRVQGASTLYGDRLLFDALTADRATAEAVFTIIDTSLVWFTNTNINNHGSAGQLTPCTIKNTARFVWEGGNGSRLDGLKFTETSTGNIKINTWSSYVGGAQPALELGTENAYNASVTGTSGTWKDNTTADWNNWVNANNTHSPKVFLEVKDGSGMYNGIRTHNTSILHIQNSDLNGKIEDYDANYNGVSATIRPYNSSTVFLTNVHCRYIGTTCFNGTVKAYNCNLYHDCDNLPRGGMAQVYDSSYWNTYIQGSHCIESSVTYNKHIIPNWEIVNSPITYMGDDALNNLSPDQLKKEWGCNANFVSDTTSVPDVTALAGAATWATGQAYTAGTYLKHSDNRVYVVISNHTSGTFNTDYLANKIRIVFGCYKESDGFYRQFYYKSGIILAAKQGPWHGGRFRNRGCALFIGGFANVHIYNSPIIDHVNQWSWGTGLVYSTEGYRAYNPSSLKCGYNYTYMVNVSYHNIGIHSDPGTLGQGLDICPSVSYSKADYSFHYFDNISISGESIVAGVVLGINGVTTLPDKTKHLVHLGHVSTNVGSYPTIQTSGNGYLQGRAIQATMSVIPAWYQNPQQALNAVVTSFNSNVQGGLFTQGDARVGGSFTVDGNITGNNLSTIALRRLHDTAQVGFKGNSSDVYLNTHSPLMAFPGYICKGEGTISVTAGSTTITGTGTEFNKWRTTKRIFVPGVFELRMLTQSSDTAGTFESNCPVTYSGEYYIKISDSSAPYIDITGDNTVAGVTTNPIYIVMPLTAYLYNALGYDNTRGYAMYAKGTINLWAQIRGNTDRTQVKKIEFTVLNDGVTNSTKIRKSIVATNVFESTNAADDIPISTAFEILYVRHDRIVIRVTCPNRSTNRMLFWATLENSVNVEDFRIVTTDPGA